MNFIFLTRCYSPKNIGTIKENIKSTFNGTMHTYKHLIVVDLTHESSRNQYLEFTDNNTILYFIKNKAKIDTQNTFGMDASLALINGYYYVYVLDDDNILHPDFLNVCSEINDEDAVVFKIEGKENLGNPSIFNYNTPVGHIDWSNFIFKLNVAKRLKIGDDKGTRCEDGLFFKKLIDNKCSIKFIDNIYAYYNKLPRN